MIPEDIIYDTDILKQILGEDIPDVSEEQDAKKKIKKISDIVGMDINTIESTLIYWFIKRKNSDYQSIVDCLNKIIEGR